MEEVKYIPHKLKANDKSSVWYYFLVPASGGPTAQCKKCNKVLKTCFGSTKGLLTHLKYHKIELERKPNKPAVKMPAKRSLIWNHFENKDTNNATCKHCWTQINFNGSSIGNLRRHLKLQHPLIPMHDKTSNRNDDDGSTLDEELIDREENPTQSEQELEVGQSEVTKVPTLKPKYEIINGKVASASPTRSINSSTEFDCDISNLYEKQIEFVDGYLVKDPFINEDIQHDEPRPPKVSRQENSFQRNQHLHDLKTRVEIQFMRAKTAYFKKHTENLDIERTVLLLKAKKLELEVEKLRNETARRVTSTEQI
ncbi:uncharacterized protein LOC101449266 isoform X2 [Ceratitis capitata]|uniref:uncharacterized protein LOC101449266 isoform X2 n=1 Tax=Ceratitis capitata TaxID=7213 RepID=UPI000329A51C|nr:uncharacterized protein LOC101449266 isoform X2 [Ceratitis capitata]